MSEEKFPFEKEDEKPCDTKPEEATQETTQESGKKQPPATTPLALEHGVAAPKSVEEQYRLAKLYLSSGFLPTRFETIEQIVVAMHFAKENFPESPLTALRQIAVIEGVPSLFGDLPLAKVMKSGLCSYKKEYILDSEMNEICIANKNLNAEIFAAVCTVRRTVPGVGNIEATSVFTVEDAKTANLWDKKSKSGRPTAWVTYPKDMMKYRARARALKDLFPDVLNGVAIAEFDFETTMDGGRVIEGPTRDVAEELNKTYSE
jgi:hypothetical protein